MSSTGNAESGRQSLVVDFKPLIVERMTGPCSCIVRSRRSEGPSLALRREFRMTHFGFIIPARNLLEEECGQSWASSVCLARQ